MRYQFLFAFLLLTPPVFSQSALPVIRASERKVAISDGGYLDKNAWSLSPGIRPDVFIAARTRKTKWVTFYTNEDSIRIEVKPGTKTNFVVLLNGKDSCFTQVASSLPAPVPQSRATAAHDTIPFTLTSYNAIRATAVINGTDTLSLHFDLSSFGFHITKEAILQKTSLFRNLPGQTPGETTIDFGHLNQISRLQIGNLIWTSPALIATTLMAYGMDGRFGWDFFEGKIVEINYDKNILVIYSRLPKNLNGFVASKLLFINNFPGIKAAFNIVKRKHTGNFLLDTGSDRAIILDSTWAAIENFTRSLDTIVTSTLKDPRGATYVTTTVLAPLLTINKYALGNIPTLVLAKSNPGAAGINYIGNDVLKRFNMLVDFTHDRIYIKANSLMHAAYRQRV